jgi:hypothetical protein
VLTRDVILFREQVRRLARRGEVGYRLLLHDVGIWFPLLGRSRRWGGGWRDTPYYPLNPFEPPRVPIEAHYQLAFIDPQGGHRQPDPPHSEILVTFPEDMSRVPALAHGLAILKKMDLRRRRNTTEEEQSAASTPPSIPPQAEEAAHQPMGDDEDTE